MVNFPVLDQSTRLAVVSSLYGPGNFGAWIMTIISVIVSWTVNRKFGRKDIINNDFIAALALPAIAAAHTLWQIPRASAVAKVLFTSFTTNSLQDEAAIEAPLTVCETFLAISPLLLAITAYRRQKKRALLVLAIVGMACSCELMLYLQTRDLRTVEFNTSRIFLFQLRWGIFLYSAFVVTATIAFVVDMFRTWYASKDDIASVRQKRFRRWLRSRLPKLIVTSGPLIVMYTQRTTWEAIRAPSQASMWDDWNRLHLPMINNGFSSVELQVDLLLVGNAFSFPDAIYHEFWPFIPQTTSSIEDLDQAVALAIGAIALGFSIYDALKSLRRVESRIGFTDRVNSSSIHESDMADVRVSLIDADANNKSFQQSSPKNSGLPKAAYKANKVQ